MKIESIIIMMLFAMTLIPFASAQTQDEPTIAMLQIDNIEPYAGSIPPGHLLYGFKLMFENADEMLTFDRTRRIEKKLEHAQTRLAEAKLEMSQNREISTSKVMLRYAIKMASVESNIEKMTYDDLTELSDEKKSRLEDVSTKIQYHEQVLTKLSENNPDNVGLQNAVQSAEQLRERFEEMNINQFIKSYNRMTGQN